MDLFFCNRHSAFFIYVNQLTKYYRLMPCFVKQRTLGASSVAKLFFDNVARFFGVPSEVISDRDPKSTASL